MPKSLRRSITKKEEIAKKANSLFKIKICKTPRSCGKAFKNTLKSLPHSPQKQKAVVGESAKFVGLHLQSKLEKPKHPLTTEKQ